MRTLFGRAAVLLVMLGALVQGLVFLFLVPPWQHYDEPTHFEYAWLVANRPGLPQPGDEDAAMQLAVARSMVEHGFYRGMPLPDLTQRVSLGYSELGHPPAYYILASLPLRLLRDAPLVTQLRAARGVSLVLFMVSVVAAWGVARELTAPGHALRWALPLSLATLPTATDVLTSVNSDVGAVAAVSVFLWGVVRLIQRGLGVRRLLWVAAAAGVAAVMKNTAAITVALLPVAVVIAAWRGRGWPWRWLGLAATLGLAALLAATWSWGDAARWYRPEIGAPQRAPTLAGDALVIEAEPNLRYRYLLNPIRSADLAALRGAPVTIAGWVWADRPVVIARPGLVWGMMGSRDITFVTTPLTVTTTPTFVSWTTTVPTATGVLYYSLFGSVEDGTGNARVFLRMPVLAAGTFPATPPSFDTAAMTTGSWDGKPFRNVLRNANLAQEWPRLRPWVEARARSVVERSPAHLFAAAFDLEHNGPLVFGVVAPHLADSFARRFAWGHVRLNGGVWTALHGMLLVISSLGVGWWITQRHHRAPHTPSKVPNRIVSSAPSPLSMPTALDLPTRSSSILPALIFLGICGLVVWGLALSWALPYRIARLPLPSARYAFPVLIPTLLWLTGGWWAAWPRRWKTVGMRIFVIIWVLLDVAAILTIWRFYR